MSAYHDRHEYAAIPYVWVRVLGIAAFYGALIWLGALVIGEFRTVGSSKFFFAGGFILALFATASTIFLLWPVGYSERARAKDWFYAFRDRVVVGYYLSVWFNGIGEPQSSLDQLRDNSIKTQLVLSIALGGWRRKSSVIWNGHVDPLIQINYVPGNGQLAVTDCNKHTQVVDIKKALRYITDHKERTLAPFQWSSVLEMYTDDVDQLKIKLQRNVAA